jgi:hypothetical protein
MPLKYKVVRNCCTSGNCFECRGVTPYGEPLQVIQGSGYSKKRAEQVANGWKTYQAKVEVSRARNW